MRQASNGHVVIVSLKKVEEALSGAKRGEACAKRRFQDIRGQVIATEKAALRARSSKALRAYFSQPSNSTTSRSRSANA